MADYTLTSNVENGWIISTSSAKLTGNTLNNVLYAGKGNNTLAGGGGMDTVSYLYGANGTTGVTVSLVTTAAQATGGSGTDTLIGIAHLTGSANADRLTGNSAANFLDGGTGIDILIGGDGSDTYYVRDEGDTVTETNPTASTGGYDQVYSYLTGYTLTANVENGRIMKTGSANLTGNALNNLLYAGKGNNTLAGGGGKDTVSYLYGDNGTTGVTVSLATTAAQATGGSGTDTLIGIINLTGSANADRLTGNSAANFLDGGAGNDILTGGDGNDTYYVRDEGDTVTETNATLSTGGTDFVYSYWTRYTLTTNVENGQIMSAGAANLTGNALNNVLYAGVGNNVIDGGDGVDTVSYFSNAISDGATTGINANLATGIVTGSSGSDSLIKVENLYGTNLADVLSGTTGNNSLSGDAGNDSLIGKFGDDRLTGGGGNDILNGGTGFDTAVFSGASTGYRISYGSAINTLTVTDIDVTNGDNGTDTLQGVEKLQFSDKTIWAGEANNSSASTIFSMHGGASLGLVGTLANFSKAAYSLGTWETQGDNRYINDVADSGGARESGRHADDVKSELFGSGEWRPIQLTFSDTQLPPTQYLRQEVSDPFVDPVIGIDVGSLNVDSSWSTIAPPLGYTTGTVVNGLVYANITNKYENGLFTNGNAAAFVARCGDSIVLSFRGTNDNRDYEADSGTLNVFDGSGNHYRPDVGDWNDMAAHYAHYAPLMTALNAYINDGNNGITNVYVTGHSLGGAMALKYMSDHVNTAAVAYEAITFAAPSYFNTPKPYDSRITSIEIQDDPVPELGGVLNPDGRILHFIGDKTTDGDVNNHSMEFYRDIAWGVDDATWSNLLSRNGETEILLGGNRQVAHRVEDFIVDSNSNADSLNVNTSEPIVNTRQPSIELPRSIDVVYGGVGNDTLTGDLSFETFLGE